MIWIGESPNANSVKAGKSLESTMIVCPETWPLAGVTQEWNVRPAGSVSVNTTL